MKTIPFLWTNDDVTFGQVAELECMCAFLDEAGVPGTFFVVPIRSIGSIDQDAALIEGIRAAERAGHEFHQHGTRHAPFECGIPDLDMLAAAPEVRRKFEEDRFAIEASHTVESLTALLSEGREIWRAAFGAPSRGFRPGWGSFCGNLYRAADALGFEWISARVVSMTSWRRNFGQWDALMDFREGIPSAPARFPGTKVYEIPMTGGEYAFKVPDDPEKIQSMVALALAEFSWCHERNLPFVMVSHWPGLAFGEGAGYEVHRRFLKQVRESGKAEFLTLNHLFDREVHPAAEAAGPSL